MNKTLKALLKGYVLFDVNGEKFFLYNTALTKRKAIEGSVIFTGFTIFSGWYCFYLREVYDGQ